jgi:hypothetical protein
VEQSEIIGQVTAILLVIALLICGCVNPFAPALRSGGSSTPWTEAQTVGELLQNFKLAYELGDSLQYADLLDDQFQFQYYDAELQRMEGWFRDTDLRATARMFRSFHNISLIWGELPDSVESLAAADSMIEIYPRYTLNLDELSALNGFAYFTLLKPASQRFRIVIWRDDF